jgi:hypothetical protein
MLLVFALPDVCIYVFGINCGITNFDDIKFIFDWRPKVIGVTFGHGLPGIYFAVYINGNVLRPFGYFSPTNGTFDLWLLWFH